MFLIELILIFLLLEAVIFLLETALRKKRLREQSLSTTPPKRLRTHIPDPNTDKHEAFKDEAKYQIVVFPYTGYSGSFKYYFGFKVFTPSGKLVLKENMAGISDSIEEARKMARRKAEAIAIAHREPSETFEV